MRVLSKKKIKEIQWATSYWMDQAHEAEAIADEYQHQYEELASENSFLHDQLRDANNELTRHHHDFEKISEWLVEYFDTDMDWRLSEAEDLLKRIRGIVG